MGGTGELLTRASIWLAMIAWTLAILRSGRPSAMWAWAVGLDAYLLHIGLSFAFFYDWSLVVAWEATARDSAETVGIDSGFGIVVNFLFLALLGIDFVSQWRTGRRKCAGAIDFLVAFLILNGAVIFGEGAVRGLGICLLAAILWGRFRRRGGPGGPGENDGPVRPTGIRRA